MPVVVVVVVVVVVTFMAVVVVVVTFLSKLEDCGWNLTRFFYFFASDWFSRVADVKENDVPATTESRFFAVLCDGGDFKWRWSISTPKIRISILAASLVFPNIFLPRSFKIIATQVFDFDSAVNFDEVLNVKMLFVLIQLPL